MPRIPTPIEGCKHEHVRYTLLNRQYFVGIWKAIIAIGSFGGGIAFSSLYQAAASDRTHPAILTIVSWAFVLFIWPTGLAAAYLVVVSEEIAGQPQILHPATRIYLGRWALNLWCHLMVISIMVALMLLCYSMTFINEATAVAGYSAVGIIIFFMVLIAISSNYYNAQLWWSHRFGEGTRNREGLRRVRNTSYSKFTNVRLRLARLYGRADEEQGPGHTS